MGVRLYFIAALAASAYAQSWKDLPGSLFGPQNHWVSCREASWPVTSIGKKLEPQTPDNELCEMLAQVDTNRIQHIVTTLANFDTRHTLSAQNSSTRSIGAARDWIYGQMQESSQGRMDVHYDSYIQPVASRISFPVNITNVVARINGSIDSNRTYVVTGHYDSRRIDIMDYTNDAPGADDDATGVAVLMEMARICALHQPKATMIFAATAGEEQGLYGATHLAQTLKNASVDVQGDWNNDIVGTGKSAPFAPINDHTVRLFGASIMYPNTTPPAESAILDEIGGENDSPARNLGRFIAEVAAGAAAQTDMQVALVYHADRFLRGGDHEAFLAAGFPAVRFTEPVEDYRHQHQDPRVQDGTVYGDLLRFVDFAYVARVARVNLASMWAAANAPAPPRDVTISQVVGFPAASEATPLEDVGNDSQFAWTLGTGDPLLASYELVWRSPGSLQWTDSLDVGYVGNVTVNLPKDALQFGVRSVGKDGMKDPAVYPLPVTS